MERRRAFGYASVLWRSVVVDAPRPTKMGNIASPWRNDAAASHARAPLKHPIAYDLALRPRAAIFQCHGRLGWALIHPRNRVYVGCRRKPGGQISAPSRLLLTRRGSFGQVKPAGCCTPRCSQLFWPAFAFALGETVFAARQRPAECAEAH